MKNFSQSHKQCRAVILLAGTLLFSGVHRTEAQIGKEDLPDINPTVYKNYLNSKLQNTVKGYAFYLTKDGNYVTSDARGTAKTAQDNNGVALPYKESTLQEIASVSKTITAVAMLRVLEKSAAVHVNSAIGPWLPKGWKVSPSFAAITFRQLLSHTSGLRTDTLLESGDGYENYLEQIAAKPVDPELQKVSSYWNSNFQLLRIVMPNILDANHRANDANWSYYKSVGLLSPKQYNAAIAASGSSIYRNYVMTYLFKPAGITTPTCNPLVVENLAWAYQNKNSTSGSPGKDHSLYCSSGFWQMTAKDLALFITKVMLTEDIISNSTKAIMNNSVNKDVVGWSHKALRGNGYNYGHGGDVNWGAPAVHSYVLYMPGEYVAYVQVNSDELGSKALRALLYEAFDEARKYPYNCESNGGTYQFPTSSFAGHISKVGLGTLQQASGKSTGYAFYNQYSTSLKQDSSYTLSLQSSYGSLASSVYWSVWIDYNANEVFEENERVYHGKSTSGLQVKSVIKIPATALLGTTRMRVALKRHDTEGIANACQSFQYGEVEDYLLNVTKPCGLITAMKTVNITSTGAQVTFNKPVDNVGFYSIRYQSLGANSFQYVNVPESEQATIVHQLLALSPNVSYRWSVKSNCGDYGPFQTFTTQDVTICGTDVYEGNHNAINAAPISFGQSVHALICSNTSTADQDWYKFEVVSNTLSGKKVNMDLLSLPADYDLYLYTEESQLIASSLNRGIGNESIEKILSAGTYYVRIVGYNGAEHSQDYYNLKVTQSDDIKTTLSAPSATESTSLAWQVYPNPVADGQLTVEFSQVPNDASYPQVTLVKSMGSALSPSFTYEAPEGKIRINTRGLEKGVYTLKVILGSVMYSKLISVQ